MLEWIKSQIPLTFPEDIELKEVIHEENNILYGHTKIQKITNNIKIIITIHISNNLLTWKGIQQGKKMILIHEVCHIINPFHPDKVMKLYFPNIFLVWSNAQKVKAIKCDIKITEEKKDNV